MTRRAACAATLLLATLAGCSSGDRAAPRSTATPRVELGFTQLLPDEGTRRALLRVENLADEPLPVTAAGLRWSGYGDFTDAQDATLAPGQTLDLRVLLPRPDCADGEGPVVGVVRTEDAEVAQELTVSGQVFVRRTWGAWCAAQLVKRTVLVEYAAGWRVATGPDGEPAATGALRLTRVGGTAPVAVVGADGSVLHDLRVAERRLGSRAGVVAATAAVLPGNRCDEHARGQATAPFAFAVVLRIGAGDDAREARVLVPPPLRVQRLATRALDLACTRRS